MSPDDDKESFHYHLKAMMKAHGDDELLFEGFEFAEQSHTTWQCRSGASGVPLNLFPENHVI